VGVKEKDPESNRPTRHSGQRPGVQSLHLSLRARTRSPVVFFYTSATGFRLTASAVSGMTPSLPCAHAPTQLLPRSIAMPKIPC
jgi:hypothetical protein